MDRTRNGPNRSCLMANNQSGCYLAAIEPLSPDFKYLG
jgi:hypothetical protein